MADILSNLPISVPNQASIDTSSVAGSFSTPALDNLTGGSSGLSNTLTNLTGNSAVNSLNSIAGGSLNSIPGLNVSSSVGSTGLAQPTSTNSTPDLRVRLEAPTGQESAIYGANDPTNILSILYKTGGVLFPYTPTISFSQDVDYRSLELTHVNGDIYSYGRTPSVQLSVSGKFTVQNQREGQYALAVIHFLRTCSKMYFGNKDNQKGLAGLPPPILTFNGYGNYMFNNLNVILKSHNFSLDDSVDYQTVAMDNGANPVRLPSIFTISMTLIVQQTTQAMRTTFSLDDFRTGALMRGSNSGWI